MDHRDAMAIDHLIGLATDDCASKAQRNAAAQRLVRYMRTLRRAQQATKTQRAARDKVIREAAARRYREDFGDGPLQVDATTTGEAVA